MTHQQTALRSILREAGIRRQTAARIEKVIEDDDFIGLTGDDVAGALLRWSENKHMMTRATELAVAASERMSEAERATLLIPFEQ